MIDCHVHTARCGHASGSLDEYVTAAERAGVEILTFADHLPLPSGFAPGYAMPAAELPHYVADVTAAREARGGRAPEVLLGIEADWMPGRDSELREMLAAYPFDVVLGSVHFIDDWAFDDPEHTDGYAEWDIDELWERYFSDVMRATRSGLFDVVAHPDLVKKFRYRPGTEPLELYYEAARAFAAAGVAVELSTAGLRKPCTEIYPSPALLEACRREGVPVTLGSDAHAPEEVGYRMDAAHEALQAAGYDSVVVFRGRRAEERAL